MLNNMNSLDIDLYTGTVYIVQPQVIFLKKKSAIALYPSTQEIVSNPDPGNLKTLFSQKYSSELNHIYYKYHFYRAVTNPLQLLGGWQDTRQRCILLF